MLATAIRGVAALVAAPPLVNVDFADVRAVLLAAGGAASSASARRDRRGRARGRARVAAARRARARRSAAVVHFAGGPTLALSEVAAAAEALRATMRPDANIIFGASVTARPTAASRCVGDRSARARKRGVLSETAGRGEGFSSSSFPPPPRARVLSFSRASARQVTGGATGAPPRPRPRWARTTSPLKKADRVAESCAGGRAPRKEPVDLRRGGA